jgi:hypothetical protein
MRKLLLATIAFFVLTAPLLAASETKKYWTIWSRDRAQPNLVDLVADGYDVKGYIKSGADELVLVQKNESVYRCFVQTDAMVASLSSPSLGCAKLVAPVQFELK